MSVEIVNGNEPWLAHFEEEKYLSCPKGTVEHDLALIIKGMLLSDTGIDDAARTAAHQINAYYWARNLDSGPQFQYGIEDEPSYDFLSLLYSMIVRMAPFVSYSGNKQDKLVGLFLELHKVPRNPVKVWNVCLFPFLYLLLSNMISREITSQMGLVVMNCLLRFWMKLGIQIFVRVPFSSI